MHLARLYGGTMLRRNEAPLECIAVHTVLLLLLKCAAVRSSYYETHAPLYSRETICQPSLQLSIGSTYSILICAAVRRPSTLQAQILTPKSRARTQGHVSPSI